MSETEFPAADYDPTSESTLEDPVPAYERLRAECPVHRFDGLERPMYTFSRRDDVQSVLMDPALWSNRLGPGIAVGDKAVGDLQRFDPPVHGIRRRFLREPFLPRAVDVNGPRIAALARSLIDGFRDAGEVELHDGYALPLPVQAFVDMMGVSDDDAENFKTWADELTIGMTFPDRARDARRAMTDYTLEQVRVRRTAVREAGLAPGQDPVGTVVPEGLLSHLACHQLDDGSIMPDGEVAGMVSQLLVAGHETTTALITNAFWLLLQNRGRWEKLVAEPHLVPNVIEESLRFDPPVLGLCKTNNEPVSRHGVDIPVDSKVMVLYASANRDEDSFEQPDEFLIDRPLLEAKRHLSFGWGIHFCLGAHLARLTGRIGLTALIEELPDLRLVEDVKPERVGAPFLWGRSRLNVCWG
ncbi:MAG: cytochrome P450 [Acidimicrobiales bacterium]